MVRKHSKKCKYQVTQNFTKRKHSLYARFFFYKNILFNNIEAQNGQNYLNSIKYWKMFWKIILLCGIITVLNCKFPIPKPLKCLKMFSKQNWNLRSSLHLLTLWFVSRYWYRTEKYEFKKILKIFEAQSKGKVKNAEPRTKIPLFLQEKACIRYFLERTALQDKLMFLELL